MKLKKTNYTMALLKYGLPQVDSVCFMAGKVGWMAASKNQIQACFKCKNQILHSIAYSAKP